MAERQGLLKLFEAQGKLEVSFVDLGNLAAVRAEVKPNTACLWIETPSNPLLQVVDVAALTKLAKVYGLLVAVDNTFMSPFFFRPFECGADVVVHSTTKWLNGHSDVVGGAIVFTHAGAWRTISMPRQCAGNYDWLLRFLAGIARCKNAFRPG